MSLALGLGETTDGVVVTVGFEREPLIYITTPKDKITISPKDMAAFFQYWMTKGNLSGPNDPRLKIMACMEEAKIVEGYTDSLKRSPLRIEMPNPICIDAPVHPFELTELSESQDDITRWVCPTYLTSEEPSHPNQIHDPSELRPGMNIGVQTVADHKICRVELTIAVLDFNDKLIGFKERRIPEFFEGGGEPFLYSFADLGLEPYKNGQWHKVHHCYNL